jgi:simple sugar transport system permease protein
MTGEIITQAFIIALLSSMIRIATPILFASLGELISESSGVLNLGIEGTMLMGAFAGFMVAFHTGSLWAGFFLALVAGGCLSLFMAFMSLSLRIDQKVMGLTINLFSAGITVYVYRIVFKNVGQTNLPTTPIFETLPIPLLSRIPMVGEFLFDQFVLVYAALLLVPIAYLFLYRTKYGLELRGIGHNPRALDMKGVNVRRYRYFAVIFGGMMAGAGGAFLTLASVGMFIPQLVAGRGWISIAIVIFGDWRPFRILLAVLFFGFLDSFQLQLQGVGIELPRQLLLSLPYILTVVAISLGRRRTGAPASLAIPYFRE